MCYGLCLTLVWKSTKWNQITFFWSFLFCWNLWFEVVYMCSSWLLLTASFWIIIIQWTSHDNLTEKISCFISIAKLVKWQRCKTAICDLTEKLLASNFVIFKSIWRPNAWMDPLEICFLLYQFLIYFLQEKSFSPWMACFKSNVNDLDCVSTDKSKIIKIVANWGHSRWKQLNLQKIE